ncbi:hypothetical protein FHW36_10271 [Chitinophaga polysaccharea]|uniref:Uncharacterized protein n=1 Tax=Chitinophaga polysaccharea TaxID=1293035 RepID=A0A561PW08_9BACT|nr:hypothetical protein [Chitinophaga polysaccharea]TWF42316.1 hypothetical protein FHW36_10271 [Chitinophaga polysaccharea]
MSFRTIIKRILWGLLAFLLVFISFAIYMGITTPVPGGKRMTRAELAQQADSIQYAQKLARDSAWQAWRANQDSLKHVHNWSYDTITDRMSPRKEYTATVFALDEVSLPPTEVKEEEVTTTTSATSRNRYRGYWPYRDASSRRRYTRMDIKTTTTQRTHSRYIQNSATVYLELHKKSSGRTQIMMETTEGAFSPEYATGRSSIRVRFDNRPATWFATTGSVDHDPSVLFLQQEASFIRQIKRAKSMLIEVAFLNNGLLVLEFDVHKLKWNY